MDMDKFFELLANDESIKDVPLIYVMQVALAVFEIINSGECAYKLEDI